MGFTRVYDYVTGRRDWEAAGLPLEGSDARAPAVQDAMSSDPPVCRLGDTVADARATLGESTQSVVLNHVGVIMGVLRKESWETTGDTPVDSAMRPGPATVRPGAVLGPLVERMAEKGTESVLVSDAEGRLIGVLERSVGESFLRGEAVDFSFETCEACPGWWRFRLRMEG